MGEEEGEGDERKKRERGSGRTGGVGVGEGGGGLVGPFPPRKPFFLFLFFCGITADNHAMCDVRRSRENRECW